MPRKDDEKKFFDSAGHKDLSDSQLASLATELGINGVRANGIIRRWKFARSQAESKQHRQEAYAKKRLERSERRAIKSARKLEKKLESNEDGDVQGQQGKRVGSRSRRSDNQEGSRAV